MNKSAVASGLVALALSSGALAAQAKEPSHAALLKEAKVTEADARATALTKVPSGAIASSELEKEHGKLIWSFDISRPGTKGVTEVQVDAISGAVVSTEHESAMHEAAEAAAEKAEKK